ncbi:hypothetical protein Pint_08713 [Pistacia integerrima]|uniref:Uncharacterized protein n=1 Tax=Pistacia integerrima TaxID=434235 RepID=A0ACC0XV25_9ROSI|nr:hypothetical protein Pint_08713 [Pistacia integerrima]
MQRCFKLLCALTRSSQYYCDLLLCTTEAITGCISSKLFWLYAVARGKKRKNDCLDKEKGHIPMENFVNLQIPPTLQKQLVDDCGSITHLGKLVKLPCTPTVDDILEKYRHYRLEKDGLIADSTREMIKGLHSFFDKALPIMLLYKSERQQYEDTMAVMVAPSTIYGAEHLLRLFVKLPELLVHAKIEEETSTKLQQILLDFLEYELFIILD